MKSGWRVGSVFGIPLLIDPSWFYVLALFTWQYSLAWQQEAWGSELTWLAGFAMALLLFASVLLHELGHSLVARSQGISVNSITLFLFGGIASIDRESKTPGQAFQVAIAGPAVSFGLFVLLGLVGYLLPLPEPAQAVIENLAGINFVLALFNMMPGLPLDGGQVLKAMVWKLTGSRLKGVRWAARVGQFLGWSAIALGVFAFISFSNWNFLWIALLGWFGVRNASAYSYATSVQEALMRLTAAAAMNREFQTVDAALPLAQFVAQYSQNPDQSAVYYAVAADRYQGLVAVDQLTSLERSRWDTETVQSITRPLDEIPAVAESASLAEVIKTLETSAVRQITVLAAGGTVVGMIDRGGIVRALAAQLNISTSETLIQQAADDEVSPLWTQLQAIARMAAN